MMRIFGLTVISILFSMLAQAQRPSAFVQSLPAYNAFTHFEETNYGMYNWKTFEQSDLANQKVDLSAYDPALMNAALYYQTNKIRQKYGRTQLKFEPKLRNAAMIHCYFMVNEDFFDHVNRKETLWATMKQRIENQDYIGESYGENIAKGFIKLRDEPKTYMQIAAEIVTQLMGSPKHKEILLRPIFENLGCAVEFYPQADEDGIWYFVATQDFAKIWSEESY